jgi:hypothetical protein
MWMHSNVSNKTYIETFQNLKVVISGLSRQYNHTKLKDIFISILINNIINFYREITWKQANLKFFKYIYTVYMWHDDRLRVGKAFNIFGYCEIFSFLWYVVKFQLKSSDNLMSISILIYRFLKHMYCQNNPPNNLYTTVQIILKHCMYWIFIFGRRRCYNSTWPFRQIEYCALNTALTH